MPGRWIGALVVLALVAGCGGDDTGAGDADGSSAAVTTTVTTPAAPLPALWVDRAGRPIVVDDDGREVLLRGVNLNSLAEYGENVPGEPTVVPLTDADWDAMAAHGFGVVRLLMSWSRIEPARDEYDTAYLDEVAAAVEAAAARGIHTVLDLHQDAWSATIGSPPGTTCPPGTEPTRFWDGAPGWATFTEGASTCTPGSRELSPAVLAAWDAFYADREGIRTEMAEVWGVVAERFGADPAVAGYDLLNEPGFGTRSVDRELVDLAAYYAAAVDEIRAGEARAGVAGPGRLVFFEPTVAGRAPAPGWSDDAGLVFAPHNYGESIGAIPIEVTDAAFRGVAEAYGVPMWIGEYGFFSDTDESEEKLGRYAALEDAELGVGSAWWQWRQACGDPHSIPAVGEAPGPQVQFNSVDCPGNVDLGVTDRWACLWRAYPRYAPGRLTRLAADCGPGLALAGQGRGDLQVWVPDHGRGEPTLAGTGVDRAEVTEVPGGWWLTIPVTGPYELEVS